MQPKYKLVMFEARPRLADVVVLTKHYTINNINLFDIDKVEDLEKIVKYQSTQRKSLEVNQNVQ